jgi:hypothetical protein
MPATTQLAPTHWVVTANRTDDGSVAWLREGGGWSSSLADAALFVTEAEANAAALRGKAEQRLVCDPYATRMHFDGSAIVPVSMRERIRATGPSIAIPGAR